MSGIKDKELAKSSCIMIVSFPMEHWAWRGLEFDLPEDWELLQFSKDEKQGNCAFADRYRFRFELNWRMVEGEPDMKRTISDYKSKLKMDGTMTDIRDAKTADWLGFIGYQSELLESRYGKSFGDPPLLLEVVFIWPQDRDKDIERSVLQSFRRCWPDAHGNRIHWRAFGLDFMVPTDFKLDECQVMPAMASFSFLGPKKPMSMGFKRLGMVDQWLDTGLENWFRKQTPRRVKIKERSHKHTAGHDIYSANGIYIPKGVFHARGRYESSAWRCPHDNRIYQVERTVRARNTAKYKLPPLAGNVLYCCAAMENRHG